MSTPQRRNLLVGLERPPAPVPEAELVETAARHGFATVAGSAATFGHSVRGESSIPLIRSIIPIVVLRVFPQPAACAAGIGRQCRRFAATRQSRGRGHDAVPARYSSTRLSRWMSSGSSTYPSSATISDDGLRAMRAASSAL